MEEKKPLLDAKKVATRLGLHPFTVYGKAKSGELASIRLGRSLRFEEDEVERYIQAGRKTAQKC